MPTRKITMSVQDMSRKAFDVEAMCDDLGISETELIVRCGEDAAEMTISRMVAKRHGLLRDEDDCG